MTKTKSPRKGNHYKHASYEGRPNPIALAMRTTRAFGTRRTPNKRGYSRAKVKREAISG